MTHPHVDPTFNPSIPTKYVPPMSARAYQATAQPIPHTWPERMEAAIPALLGVDLTVPSPTGYPLVKKYNTDPEFNLMTKQAARLLIENEDLRARLEGNS